MKFSKFMSSRFRDCCLGTDCELATGQQENCIAYGLFCIFIIISISIKIIISSISFVVS